MEPLLVNRKTAAKLLDVSIEKLDYDRKAGIGPAACQLGGSVKYSPLAIAEWIAKQSKQ
jgi:hypothetical protein